MLPGPGRADTSYLHLDAHVDLDPLCEKVGGRRRRRWRFKCSNLKKQQNKVSNDGNNDGATTMGAFGTNVLTRGLPPGTGSVNPMSAVVLTPSNNRTRAFHRLASCVGVLRGPVSISIWKNSSISAGI